MKYRFQLALAILAFAVTGSAQSVSHTCPNGPPTTGDCGSGGGSGGWRTYNDGPHDRPSQSEIDKRESARLADQATDMIAAGGDLDQAARLYVQALNLDSNNNFARYGVSVVLFKQGDFFYAIHESQMVGGKEKGKSKILIKMAEDNLRSDGWILYPHDKGGFKMVWNDETKQNVCRQADEMGHISVVACR